MPVPNLYPDDAPSLVALPINPHPVNPNAYNGALQLTLDSNPIRPPSKAPKRSSRSSASQTSTSASGSALESVPLTEMEKKLARATIEVHNCREMVSTWYKKAYGYVYILFLCAWIMLLVSICTP